VEAFERQWTNGNNHTDVLFPILLLKIAAKILLMQWALETAEVLITSLGRV
jgi:hypothetical protein